jgi:thiol-disulfide isomerase/thioredoxin
VAENALVPNRSAYREFCDQGAWLEAHTMRTSFLLALVAACSNQAPEAAPAAQVTANPAAVEMRGSAATATPPSIEQAIARSKAEQKPLVVEFSTSWCKPCQIFEKSLDDPRMKAAIARIVFVRYDGEAAGPGSDAAQRYHVSGFPTFLVIDKEGVVRATQSGLQNDGIDQFLQLVASAETATLDDADLRGRVAAKPHDVMTQLDAARWFADRGRLADALARYDAVVAEPSATEDQRGSARSAAMRLKRIQKWKSDLVAEKIELARSAPAAVSERDLAIATVDSGAPAADIHDALTKVLAAHDQPAAINGLIYVALAAGAKDEALAAAKRVLAGSKDPSLLDTLAECFHVHGDRIDALRTEDAAIKLADQAPTGVFAANRARFAKGTGDSDDVIKLRAEVQGLANRLAQIDDVPPAAASAEAGSDASGLQQAAMAVFTASRKLGDAAGAACASAAGKSETAFARVALDAQGRVASSIVFTDAAGTDALRACITKQLAAATLPVVPGMQPQPIEIALAGQH